MEVIEMAMRDLVYRIVPTKAVVRELKTSSGKVLNENSEFELVEKKTMISGAGKGKQRVDYSFDLDLKDEKCEKKKTAPSVHRTHVEEEAKKAIAEAKAAEKEKIK